MSDLLIGSWWRVEEDKISIIDKSILVIRNSLVYEAIVCNANHILLELYSCSSSLISPNFLTTNHYHHHQSSSSKTMTHPPSHLNPWILMTTIPLPMTPHPMTPQVQLPLPSKVVLLLLLLLTQLLPICNLLHSQLIPLLTPMLQCQQF